MAKARRIARRAHRGQLTESGELFTDHLERVARTVEERGGGWAAQQAAWLHAVPGTGVDLTRQCIPWRVLLVVQALQQAPAATRQVEDAVLVREALEACRPAEPQKSWGQPVVPAHADVLPQLLADYRERRSHKTIGAISTLFHGPADLNTPAVAELAEQWWDSGDDWEACIAVLAARGAGLLDRKRLLRKVSDGGPIAADAAIEALGGEADEDEIEVLRTVMTRPGVEWRWVRRSARARLTEIGGPAAEAALQEWAFSPLDVPWRTDRAWLHRHAADLVPRLIEALSEREWWHEAPFALGELRAEEAVRPLCESARTHAFPVPQIEALGKIGSVDAVPTLIGLLEHRSPDVRDNALRALDRIGGADVVDAAIRACDDPDVQVRDRAARVLARRGDGRAVTPLIRLCDTWHAAAAAGALARIGDPRALPTLWHLFRHHDDKAVRYAAGRGLARIEGDQQWFYAADPQRLRAHVWLLGHKPGWRDHSLERATRHTDAMVRARAAEAFGRRHDPAGAEHVRPLLADPDPRVRAAATIAIARLEQR